MTRAGRPSVVLYGAGAISRAHGAAVQCDGMRVVAVASRSSARAAERAAELGARPVTYDDVVARRVDADVAVVTTPPQCHARDALALLDAGYAVMLETPLCTTLDDADAIVEASARHQGRLLYAEHIVAAPVVQRLLAMVPTLGPIEHLEVRALQGPPDRSTAAVVEWGGGALFDVGAHPIAVALLAANAAGLGLPIAVSGRLRERGADGVDEHAVVHLHYADGLTVGVEASWQHGPGPTWDVQLASPTGVLRAELMPLPQLEHNGEPVPLPRVTAAVPQVEQYGYLAQLRATMIDLQHGTTPTMSASFGRLVLDVVCAAYRSAGRDGEQELLPFSGARDRTPLQLWRDA